ncbi:hypothetical protein WN51_13213 [Melipona quadrifasciata]|uniref:Nucleolus and neural progenitor protein-like N-terminal domain-containing protein n=1 Tax=Melipona quadrifasciata TaxID=166423 RepID=A0A0M9A3R0_9HYME|nr:hypothetical protein WN51_13213 [Melipona quadrifasciata]
MEAIWNHKQLERPPNAVCHVDRQKFDAAAFLLTLDKIIKDLTSQEMLHKEAAILSRLIYRMKRKFRSDKGMKSMLKVNKALLRYLSMSLDKEYENLKNHVEIDQKYITLSSKQMVEYVLVKTQGFAKLILHLEEVSKHAAHFLKCRIGLGHAWSMAIISYAVISRIWILSRYLLKKICTWYNDLYQYLHLFEIVGLPWLPENYELTDDLKSWLLVPWIDESTPRHVKQINIFYTKKKLFYTRHLLLINLYFYSVPNDYGLKNTMFKLITPYDSDEDLASNIQDNNKETKSENAVSCLGNKNISNKIATVTSNNDTGDRHSFELECIQNVSITFEKKHKITNVDKAKEKAASFKNSHRQFYVENLGNEFITEKKKKNSKIKIKKLAKKEISEKLITFDNINNKSDLKLLLNKESYPGLDKLQWNIIKNKNKKLLDKLENCSDEIKQSILFKKVIKRIKNLIA